MEAFLPVAFMTLAGLALLWAVSTAWLSLRSLLGGDAELVVGQSEAARRRGEWLDEKEAVLRSLKDLEFERAVGKLSEEDFERLDAQFRRRAKQLMRQLDDDLKAHREAAQKLIAAELETLEQPGKSA
jgi:ABC-type phosphate transport system auxiliary subunit